ncbi:MAG: type II toxin-antitoxin system Phd/YefM family antitoxin [Streptosporangiaceae bacterium]
MTDEQEIRRGYEQFVPPQAPPGMYFDPASELLLPRGVRLASRGQVASAWFLGLLLFCVTLGIGYITWSLFVWGQGRTPAQRILSLRCWLPEPRQVAGRQQMALRQIAGFCLNGELLSGFFIWLTGRSLRSVGDFFAGTVILHDPDGVLALSSPRMDTRSRPRRGQQYDSLTATRLLVILLTMTVLPLGDVKSHLSEIVGRVHDHHERVTVTVYGRPSAILIAPEDLEALEETLEIMRDATTMNRLAESDAELARGEYVSAGELAEAMRRRQA